MCLSSCRQWSAAADRNDLNPSIAAHSLDGSVVLFDDVVQIFDLTDFDVCLLFCIVAWRLPPCWRRSVDRDRFRDAMTTMACRRNRNAA